MGILVRVAVLVAIWGWLVGCAAQVMPPAKIALLAPFEGRYREVGYDALYAARLALVAAGYDHITLLPVDDGGTVENAADRIQALENDPAVSIILASGPFATTTSAQAALDSLSMVVIGHWGAHPATPQTFVLTSHRLDQLLTSSTRSITEAASGDETVIGNELFALRQLPLLHPDLQGVRVLSSATLPDADFRAQYAASDPFAPDPNLLATLTYDATRLAAEAIVTQTPLAQMRYEGLNGTIRFDERRYWRDAPIHTYRYDETGRLVPEPAPS